jgi:hypothetical protein
MRVTMGDLRHLIREELNKTGDFSLIQTPAGGDGLMVVTPQDGATRAVVVIRHPEGDAQAYFKSSGASGYSYRGEWVPFEGWATSNRVPRGGAITDVDPDEDIQLFQPGATFADNVWLAKTYWNVGGAKAPEGTVHARGSEWISDWLSTNEPSFSEMTVDDNMRKFGSLNRWLLRLGAIDQSRDFLNVKPHGRRMLLGLEEVS